MQRDLDAQAHNRAVNVLRAAATIQRSANRVFLAADDPRPDEDNRKVILDSVRMIESEVAYLTGLFATQLQEVGDVEA